MGNPNWRCGNIECGYVSYIYRQNEGDPTRDIPGRRSTAAMMGTKPFTINAESMNEAPAPGTPFEKLTEVWDHWENDMLVEWTCPQCNSPQSEFYQMLEYPE